MTIIRDFDNLAAIARERQNEILRVSARSEGHRPGGQWLVGVVLAVVCAPLAALFFLQVW